jgi:hypothetical protein
MQIPEAMNIYAAQDHLKHDRTGVEGELKELHTAGAAGSFEDGYILGLAVARVMLAGIPAIYQAGLKPEDLL